MKTDATDGSHLAEMYYRGDVKPHLTWEETFTIEKAKKLEEVLGDWRETRRSPSQSQALLGTFNLLFTMIRQLEELEK